MLACLLGVLLAADGGKPAVGHIVGPRGSVTFTATSLSNADLGLERDASGTWNGTVGSRIVELREEPAQIAGESGLWVTGQGVAFALVHHAGAWFAKGSVFGTPIRVIYPDGQGLEGWGRLRFDGLAAQPDPPIIPFVLSIWAAARGPSVRGGSRESDTSPLDLGGLVPAGPESPKHAPQPQGR